MTSKIRIKMGPIEVEYEGSENFLKEELPQLLEAVSNLYKESGLSTKASFETPTSTNEGSIEDLQPFQFQGTTNSVAAKLQCKTEPDLIMAAARLTFVLMKDKFTRDELLKEMQTASNYYNKSYGGGNLTKCIFRLVKNGTLTEPSKNNYSLTASAKSELGARIA